MKVELKIVVDLGDDFMTNPPSPPEIDWFNSDFLSKEELELYREGEYFRIESIEVLGSEGPEILKIANYSV